jgi:hypothetical protein
MIDPSLRRRKPLSRFPKKKPLVRVGKLGIVRLTGKALTKLRHERFDMDGHRCVDCHVLVAWDEREAEELNLPVGELSHRRPKRLYGDTLENTCCRCRRCHRNSHNAGGKPAGGRKIRLCRHCGKNGAGGFFDNTLCGPCWNTREEWDKSQTGGTR